MSTAPNHQHSIAWLDSKSRWFRARAELTEANIDDLTSVMQKMIFVAPVGDRVRHSVQLRVKNLRSLQKELNYMATVTTREARRLEGVDHRVAQFWVSGEVTAVVGVIDPLAQELAEYRANQAAWEERRFPPEPVPEEPDTEVTTDVASGEELEIVPIEVPAEPQMGPLIRVRAAPATKERRVMDIATIRLAAEHIAGVSKGMQDHQTAILRALTDIPTDISKRMQARLKRSRQACAGGFERQAPGLLRQSNLLNTRIKTAGLFDGVFNPGIEPIGGIPALWRPALQDRMYRPPLAEHTALVEQMANELNSEMDVLLRYVSRIWGDRWEVPIKLLPPPLPLTPPTPPIPPGPPVPPDESDPGIPVDPPPPSHPTTPVDPNPGSSGGGGLTGGIGSGGGASGGAGGTGSGGTGGLGSGGAGDFVCGTGATVVTGAGAQLVSRKDATEEADAAAVDESTSVDDTNTADDDTQKKTDQEAKKKDYSVRRGRHHEAKPKVTVGHKFESAVKTHNSTKVVGAAAGAVIGGTAGGVVMSNKKARKKIGDWKSYVASKSTPGPEEGQNQ